MDEIKKISAEIKETYKDLIGLAKFTFKYIPKYCEQKLGDIARLCELENQIAILSDRSLAHELVRVVKLLDYNYDITCKLLEDIINDIKRGEDPVEILWDYDRILYKQWENYENVNRTK